eukprot:6212741-Pleurochrysis_carterae.AAC.1
MLAADPCPRMQPRQAHLNGGSLGRNDAIVMYVHRTASKPPFLVTCRQLSLLVLSLVVIHAHNRIWLIWEPPGTV